MNAFSVVEQFERRVADYCGAMECVTTSTGTMAIFLALMLERERLMSNVSGFALQYEGARGTLPVVICPARTFVSVPMAIKQAGFRLKLVSRGWVFSYQLAPLRVVDAALDFRQWMHVPGMLTCLSFQARKILNIGEGGAILLDDKAEAETLRAMRYSGRRGPLYRVEDITAMGWHCYMTPEKAARGLHLMEYMRDIREQLPAIAMRYPDLRDAPFFREDV